jgi:hypothetical protein
MIMFILFSRISYMNSFLSFVVFTKVSSFTTFVRNSLYPKGYNVLKDEGLKYLTLFMLPCS